MWYDTPIDVCEQRGPVHNGTTIRTFAQSKKSFNFFVPFPTPTTARCAVVQRQEYTQTKILKLTEDAICERIQRASLSNLHVVFPPSLFSRRLLEFFFVDEETGVAYELFQLLQDVHGRWSGWLYYAEEAR
jgi:hypothetical protein